MVGAVVCSASLRPHLSGLVSGWCSLGFCSAVFNQDLCTQGCGPSSPSLSCGDCSRMPCPQWKLGPLAVLPEVPTWVPGCGRRATQIPAQRMEALTVVPSDGQKGTMVPSSAWSDWAEPCSGEGGCQVRGLPQHCSPFCLISSAFRVSTLLLGPGSAT